MRIVLIIISPIIFFYDLLASKFSNKHIISNRTYLLMRYLYKYFGGFFFQFISYFLIGIKSKLPSNFSKTFSRHKVIDRLECEKISKAILRTSIINKPIADQKLKLNLNQNDLDFEYYQKKNLIRLDFSSQELVKNKTISSFATNIYWSKEIKKILGTRPYFVGIDAWLTLPPLNMMDKYDDIGNFVSSQMWHRDCDKLRDIKVMTYLTDVPSENDGPFEIVQGTNKLNFFHPKNYLMGSAMRVKNDYVQNKMKKSIFTFLGEKGDSIIADTRALHRGKTILNKNSYRLVLQLYFSNHVFGKIKLLEPPTRDWDSYEIWHENFNRKDCYYNTLFKI